MAQFSVASTEWRVMMQTLRVLRQWHGAPAFNIYYDHAPEMLMIRNAMGPYKELLPWIELHLDITPESLTT